MLRKYIFAPPLVFVTSLASYHSLKFIDEYEKNHVLHNNMKYRTAKLDDEEKILPKIETAACGFAYGLSLGTIYVLFSPFIFCGTLLVIGNAVLKNNKN